MFQQQVVDLDPVGVPDELKLVPPAVLESYVLANIRRFSRVFASQLAPTASAVHYEAAYSRALFYSVAPEKVSANLTLKFRHRCRHSGCKSVQCLLCKNNPLKACGNESLFDEFYAVNSPIKAKCGSEITIELFPSTADSHHQLSGLHLLVSVVDGDSDVPVLDGLPSTFLRPSELAKTDAGEQLLIGPLGTRCDAQGRILLPFKGSRVRLADISLVRPSDSFIAKGRRYSSLRLLLRAVRVDPGSTTHKHVPQIQEAVSAQFVVQRADEVAASRTAAYPHSKDSVLKLRAISQEAAKKLFNLGAFMGRELPEQLHCVETVAQLCALVQLLAGNRQLQEKVSKLLGFDGAGPRWQWLCKVVLAHVVEDDSYLRVWYKDEQRTIGLLFSCQQGQVKLDAPIGLVHRLVLPYCCKMVVDPLPEEVERVGEVSMLVSIAQLAWTQPFHPGWYKVDEQLEWTGVSRPPTPMLAHPLPITCLGMQDPLSHPPTRQQSPSSPEIHPVMSCGSSGMAQQQRPSVSRSSDTGTTHSNRHAGSEVEPMNLAGRPPLDAPTSCPPLTAVPPSQLQSAEKALADAAVMLKEMRATALRANEAEKAVQRQGGRRSTPASPFFPSQLPGVPPSAGSAELTTGTNDTVAEGHSFATAADLPSPRDSTSQALQRLGLTDPSQPPTIADLTARKPPVDSKETPATRHQGRSTAPAAVAQNGSGDFAPLLFQQSSTQSSKRCRDTVQPRDDSAMNSNNSNNSNNPNSNTDKEANNPHSTWAPDNPRRVVLYHSESGGRHLPIGRIERGDCSSAPLAITISGTVANHGLQTNASLCNEHSNLSHHSSAPVNVSSAQHYPPDGPLPIHNSDPTDSAPMRPLPAHLAAPSHTLNSGPGGQGSHHNNNRPQRHSDTVGSYPTDPPTHHTHAPTLPQSIPEYRMQPGAPPARPRYPVVLDLSEDRPPTRYPPDAPGPRFPHTSDPLPIAPLNPNTSDAGPNPFLHQRSAPALFEDPPYSLDALSRTPPTQQQAMSPSTALPPLHPHLRQATPPSDLPPRTPVRQRSERYHHSQPPDQPPFHHGHDHLSDHYGPLPIHPQGGAGPPDHSDQGDHQDSLSNLPTSTMVCMRDPSSNSKGIRALKHQDTDSFKRIIPDLVSPNPDGSSLDKFLAINHNHLALAPPATSLDPTNLLDDIDS